MSKEQRLRALRTLLTGMNVRVAAVPDFVLEAILRDTQKPITPRTITPEQLREILGNKHTFAVEMCETPVHDNEGNFVRPNMTYKVWVNVGCGRKHADQVATALNQFFTTNSIINNGDWAHGSCDAIVDLLPKVDHPVNYSAAQILGQFKTPTTSSPSAPSDRLLLHPRGAFKNVSDALGVVDQILKSPSPTTQQEGSVRCPNPTCVRRAAHYPDECDGPKQTLTSEQKDSSVTHDVGDGITTTHSKYVKCNHECPVGLAFIPSRLNNPKQTLTSGTHKWNVILRGPGLRPDFEKLNSSTAYSRKELFIPNEITKQIVARSITAAACLVYEQFPELSSTYRVVRVEEVE